MMQGTLLYEKQFLQVGLAGCSLSTTHPSKSRLKANGNRSHKEQEIIFRVEAAVLFWLFMTCFDDFVMSCLFL